VHDARTFLETERAAGVLVQPDSFQQIHQILQARGVGVLRQRGQRCQRREVPTACLAQLLAALAAQPRKRKVRSPIRIAKERHGLAQVGHLLRAERQQALVVLGECLNQLGGPQRAVRGRKGTAVALGELPPSLAAHRPNRRKVRQIGGRYVPGHPRSGSLDNALGFVAPPQHLTKADQLIGRP